MAGNREAIAKNEIRNYLARHGIGPEGAAIVGQIEGARNRFGSHHLGVAMALDVHPSIIHAATEALYRNGAAATQVIKEHKARGWSPKTISSAEAALSAISTAARNARLKK
jgi:hypothetical protein